MLRDLKAQVLGPLMALAMVAPSLSASTQLNGTYGSGYTEGLGRFKVTFESGSSTAQVTFNPNSCRRDSEGKLSLCTRLPTYEESLSYSTTSKIAGSFAVSFRSDEPQTGIFGSDSLMISEQFYIIAVPKTRKAKASNGRQSRLVLVQVDENKQPLRTVPLRRRFLAKD